MAFTESKVGGERMSWGGCGKGRNRSYGERKQEHVKRVGTARQEAYLEWLSNPYRKPCCVFYRTNFVPGEWRLALWVHALMQMRSEGRRKIHAHRHTPKLVCKY